MDNGELREFFVHARVDAAAVETWVAAGWLMKQRPGTAFSQVDIARARFIRDLQAMGVNDEGIPVILDLVDQLHGVRRTLREVLATCGTPEGRPEHGD